MVEQIIENLKFYFKEGLIINAKAQHYVDYNKFKSEDLNILYDYLTKSDLTNIQNINYIICVLYYISVKSPNAREVFYQKVEKAINLNFPINDANMYIIFNIIEFEEKFRIANEEDLKFFLQYLNKYSSHEKNFDNSILFFYYQSVLFYFLKEYDKCKECNNDITSFINDKEEHPDVNDNKTLLQYIEMKNFIMLLRYQMKMSVIDESMIKEHFQILVIQNKILAIKIGLSICEFYIKNNKFHQCLNFLTQLYQILKDEMLGEIDIENGIDYYLAILSRIAYCSAIVNDKKKLSSIIKKIDKKIGFLDITDQKNYYYKTFFDFLVLLYKIHIGTNNLPTEKIKQIIKTIDLNNNDNNEIAWLFTDYIPLYINIYVFDNSNSTNKTFSKYISDFLSLLKPPNDQESELPPKKIIFHGILGLYNVISKKSIHIIKERNNTNLKKEVQNYCEKLFSYLHRNYPLIQELLVPYIKESIIKIFYVYLNTYFNAHDYDKTKEILDFFENNFKKTLNIEENKCNGYEYILKLKGDLAFKNSQYKDAIDNYDKALKIEKENLGIKKMIIFNKGLSHLYLNEIDIGVKCLNEAKSFFNNMIQNKSKLIFSKIICNELEKKINNVNNLLSIFKK